MNSFPGFQRGFAKIWLMYLIEKTLTQKGKVSSYIRGSVPNPKEPCSWTVNKFSVMQGGGRLVHHVCKRLQYIFLKTLEAHLNLHRVIWFFCYFDHSCRVFLLF
jgi:hypothetical protein